MAPPMDAAAQPPLPGLVPTAGQQTAKVVEQVRMARDTYRLRLECPELARQIVPGQFFMVRERGGRWREAELPRISAN